MQLTASRHGWRQVYHDEWTTLYFWRDYATNQPALPEAGALGGPPLPPTTPAADAHELLDGAARRPSLGMWAWLRGSALVPSGAIRWSAACLLAGEPARAMHWVKFGISRSPWFSEELWTNAVYAFAGSGEKALAAKCISVLRSKGRDKLANSLEAETNLTAP